MRKLTLLVLSLWALQYIQAQKNNHIEAFKCSHKHHNNVINLTNEDMDKYDVHFYFLDIEATNESTAITGNTIIGATTKNETLSKFVIELHSGITVSKVTVNDEDLDFNHANDKIEVILDKSIEANTNFTVNIEYNRPSTLDTDGIYSNELFNDQFVTHTLSEPFYAKNWFACKQDLYDKADSVYIFVTIDKELKVGSNGLLTNITDMGDNKNRYEWKSYYPIAYYLISIAIADYKEQVDYAKPSELNGDSILIQNYFYDDSDFNYNVEAFSVTAEMIEVFSDLFTLYPFWKEKYGHSYAPIWGAMEHQTMTTTGYPDEYITAHEAGHQWFGNNVTCATWQDIWINEGFASYSEVLWFEKKYSSAIAYQHLYGAQNGARQAQTGSIYIPFDELSDRRIFSGALSYDKGACLVHMIRHEINNDDLFFGALRAFQLDFTDSVATGDDFQEFVSNYTQLDFSELFEQWYYGEGFPKYNVDWIQADGKLKMNITQTTTGSTPYFSNNIDFKISYDGSDTIIWIKPSSANNDFEINFDKTIASIELDPGNDILKNSFSTITSIIDPSSNLSVNCYPNPITTHLIINYKSNIKFNVQVYNMQGQQIIKQDAYEELTLDTKKWSNGSYAIVIRDGKSKFVKKILKN